MAKKSIVFRMTAYSAAAGKYNPNAPLDGNEDNFYVNDNLNDNIAGSCQGDTAVNLGECGALMAVADGMGGMNAGEVASDIAITTVREYFAPGKINQKMASSAAERRQYLEQVIKAADRAIKEDAKNNPEHEGMGSTIILAWIVGDELTVSWCGDSRAYRYNRAFGIEPLSRDHSYVQELANQGVITYEDTFEHPQGNIVTRSLGDPNNAAKPESRDFNIYDGDIILLCSDGLSGVLRDRKPPLPDGGFYPGDTIEDIISQHSDSMTDLRDSLMSAAEKADWYDNVTVILCQIVSGAPAVPANYKPQDNGSVASRTKNSNVKDGKPGAKKGLRIAAGALIVLILCAACIFIGTRLGKGKDVNGDNHADTTALAQNTNSEVLQSAEIKDESESVDNKDTGLTTESSTNLKIVGNDAWSDSVPDLVLPSSDWKHDLIAEVNQFSQQELKKVRDKTIEFIRSASDTDMTKCLDYVSKLKERSGFLNQTQQFNGKLTADGKKIYEALLIEIGDPDKFNPDFWAKKIKELHKFVRADRTGISPVPTQKPDEQTVTPEQNNASNENELTPTELTPAPAKNDNNSNN